LDALEFESKDPESIKAKVTPLFNDILLPNLSQQDSKTIEILADYLATIIQKSSQKDLSKLSQALQSVISPAISQEIENNKEKMIDALYPIMGGMISKYVTQSIKEMMESINKKIEDGLSFDKYKRKLKAKLTGVSEVELLLEESSDADISSLFVIHKETGLLIAEAHDEHKAIDDAVMVASMASAIKDFVNDWIQNQDQENMSEVQILSYGNATLYIESAGSVYMIAFMDSEPDYEQRKEINSFFATILKRYSKLFHSFEGDMSDEQITKLESDLYEFLNQHSDEAKVYESNKPNIAKYIFYILGALLVGWFGYIGYKQYQIETLASKISLESNSTITLKAISDDTIEVDGYINSMNQYNQIEKLLKEHRYTKIINNLHMPLSNIYSKIEDITSNQIEQQFKQINQNMHNLQNKYQQILHQNKKLINELKEMRKKVKLISKLSNLKKDIFNDFHNIFVNDPNYIGEGRLVFYNCFAENSIKYDKNKIDIIKNDYNKLISILYADDFRKKFIKHIIIEGYTNSLGNTNTNLILSSQRANSIKKYLQSLPITKKYHIKLISRGMGSKDLAIRDSVEDLNASKRIKMRFEFDENKILEGIKQVQK
jgi:outer membrane protein OmpA-like peptidoglycan-associated protein